MHYPKGRRKRGSFTFPTACAFLLALALATPLASHASSQSGQVIKIQVRASDGLILFYLDGAPSAKPACTNGHTYWMIKDEKSETGKRQLAMLMAARAAGLPVTVLGTGACTRWPDGEDVDSVEY
ncbi:hypothetical protein [Cognatilysobacter terrigena]|uniref:hypothetical protein n=1 Tax=Cognatilysobacter terrigena TaxID=2488749 RepID=UPI001FE29ED6|nr:hypothetical protein [Lysobacter terrigena]